jgi:S-formylglutathione hydrolase FrmB
LYDNHTGWCRRSSIERYVEVLPLIVVMPNAERSFYTDSPVMPLVQFETFFTTDLIAFVDRTFRTKREAPARALAGLSMGGYGALKLALKHPDLFCAASSLSGALDIAEYIKRGSLSKVEFDQLFGDSPIGGDDDLFAIAERADRASLPALRFDCGVDDPLIKCNRRLHTHLTELCVPHEYHEHPGVHSWTYWDTHIQETIPWVCEQLGITSV